MPLKIAFVTTCKNRTSHLRVTLPRNLSDNSEYPDCVFIVLDYGSQDDLVPYLREHHAHDIASGRLAAYSLATDAPFKMAHAKNVAHRLGLLHGADVLVNLDADNYAGQGFARFAADFFALHQQSAFLWARMVKGNMRRGISGRIAVTRSAFLKVGGYNERFDAWGPDDRDFNFRLRRLGCQPHEIPPRFLDSVSHNDRMRFREYKYVAGAEQDYESPREPWTPGPAIANYGHFGCARVWRSLEPAFAFELPDLPTRIFGIGMHKTGTVSLHEAFGLLALEAVHWPSAHWARAVWQEMRDTGRSRTLEAHYAASDLPLPLMFRELDVGYPGSKFVLTIRSEDAWLASVKRHFDLAHNPFRWQWDTDPFTHRAHLELYGRRRFESRAFRERYQRHNRSVREYFADRPHDLLVLDADRPDWAPLCNFLGLPRPAVPYPHVNQTGVVS